jgi:hypothetical protein
MPRSRLSNWSSRQRLAYIQDHLAQHGWINREALTAYFATERSLGSMDITAYQQTNGPLRKASAGEVMADGTVAVSYKLGGRLLYVANGDEVASGKRWDLLPQGGTNHADWLRRVMTAWRKDHPLASAEDAMAYFGIGKGEAKILMIVHGPVDEVRRGIWESFR